MKKLQDILDAAERHGLDSDPDHEVGDLQDVLRFIWDDLLFSDQKERAHEFALDQLDDWAPEISCTVCDEVGIPGCKGCGGSGLLTASGRKLTEA